MQTKRTWLLAAVVAVACFVAGQAHAQTTAVGVDCTAPGLQASYALAKSGASYAIRSTRQRDQLEGGLRDVATTQGAPALACALTSLAGEWDALSSTGTETVRSEYQRSAAVARAFMAEHGYSVSKPPR